MPVSDELFLAGSEAEWAALVHEWSKEGEPSSKLYPMSLSTLHSLFLRPDFLYTERTVTPLQLRLLLCTIQAQIRQYSQTNRWIPLEEQPTDPTATYSGGNFFMLRQQEEFENMLMKWNILAQRVFEANQKSELRLSCYLMSQIVWLELYICFDDVELLAGKETFETGKLYLPHLRQWVQSSSARKAIAHAGNVLKILQTSSDDLLRPIWWPVALSRIALVFWCYSVGLFISTGHPSEIAEPLIANSPLLSLNDVSTDYDPKGRVVYPAEGFPCLQDAAGTLVPLYKVSEVFDLCLQMLQDPPGYNSPLLEGMRQFLQDIKHCGIPYAALFENIAP